MANDPKTETAPSGHTHFICAGCGDHFHSQSDLTEHEKKCTAAKK